MKKIIALLLSLMMAASLCVFAEGETPATAQPAEITLRVEGVAANVYYGSVALQEGDSILTVLCRALDEKKITYEVQDGDYGKYLAAVGEDAAAKFGGWDGWVYYVNGVEGAVGIDACKPEAGDSILVCYTDAYGNPPTLMPALTAARAKTGIVTLTAAAQVAVYAEDWSVSYVTTPAADAKLIVDGTEYVTDAQGRAVLSAEDSAKEQIAVQIEHFAENGKPLVIRFAPDYTLKLDVKAEPFTDVDENLWYAPFVEKMAVAGLVNGYEDNSFKPQNTITRGEVAMILYRMAGAPEIEAKETFADVPATLWCAKAVTWCADNGIVLGADGKFMPSANVTRQDLAVMIGRMNEKVLKLELPADGEAPAFADNDEIAAYAAEAIYTLQKAGIVNGADGKFNPLGTATRAEACKMLSGLMAA
ncbi:MAG: S-layer homology domain-containing protein [Clostridia bacterium]|nr:S-layer homology domain-containing protein [Clostridia bacterium]